MIRLMHPGTLYDKRYDLRRLHLRRDKETTKVGENTYAIPGDEWPEFGLYEYRIKYYATQIITVMYEYGKVRTRIYYPGGGGWGDQDKTREYITGINVCAVQFNVRDPDGADWNTLTTRHRFRKFLDENELRQGAELPVGQTNKGNLYILDKDGENLFDHKSGTADLFFSEPLLDEDGFYTQYPAPVR